MRKASPIQFLLRSRISLCQQWMASMSSSGIILLAKRKSLSTNWLPMSAMPNTHTEWRQMPLLQRPSFQLHWTCLFSMKCLKYAFYGMPGNVAIRNPLDFRIHREKRLSGNQWLEQMFINAKVGTIQLAQHQSQVQLLHNVINECTAQRGAHRTLGQIDSQRLAKLSFASQPIACNLWL